MKFFAILVAVFAFLIVFTGSSYAAPNPNNPNVVVYHSTGPHTIPIPEQPSLDGHDLVMRNGNSGNFNQWFWNDSIGYHSVWNMTKNGKCENGYLIKNAREPEGVGAVTWGDYLVPGADYCVITNEFHP